MYKLPGKGQMEKPAQISAVELQSAKIAAVELTRIEHSLLT